LFVHDNWLKHDSLNEAYEIAQSQRITTWLKNNI